MSLCACGARLAPIGVEAPTALTMCATCATAAAGATPDVAGHHNIAAGAGMGLLAAAAAAVAWYAVVAMTQYQVSVMAVGVGYLVGRAVSLGARGQGPKLQGVAVGLTVLSMAVAEYLISLHFFNAFYAAESLPEASLVQPPGVMLSVVQESLAADPMTLLFWLLAMAVAFRVPGVVKDRDR